MWDSVPIRQAVCKFVRRTLPGLSFSGLDFYLANVPRLDSQARRCLSGNLPKHHPEAYCRDGGKVGVHP